MKDIMLDIETLGTAPGSIILSIGAVQFDMQTGEIGKTFYCNIDAIDSQKHGLTLDASTVIWWFKQNDAAIKSLEDAPTTLITALNGFEQWLENINSKDVSIWANAPSFDLVLLKAAYKAIGMNEPWFYWQEKCVRTIKAFNYTVYKSVVNNFPHNALGDCLYQIEYLVKIYKTININKLNN